MSAAPRRDPEGTDAERATEYRRQIADLLRRIEAAVARETSPATLWEMRRDLRDIHGVEAPEFHEDAQMNAPERPTAARLNDILAAGGAVVVATCTRATRYGPRHAGWFEERDGELFVRHGRGRNRLSSGGTLLVGIRWAEARG